MSPKHAMTASELQVNRVKNRFTNILPCTYLTSSFGGGVVIGGRGGVGIHQYTHPYINKTPLLIYAILLTHTIIL